MEETRSWSQGVEIYNFPQHFGNETLSPLPRSQSFDLRCNGSNILVWSEARSNFFFFFATAFVYFSTLGIIFGFHRLYTIYVVRFRHVFCMNYSYVCVCSVDSECIGMSVRMSRKNWSEMCSENIENFVYCNVHTCVPNGHYCVSDFVLSINTYICSVFTYLVCGINK